MNISQIANQDVKGKVVLIRADFNVPLIKKGRHFIVSDEFKIRQSLQTIDYLREKGAKIILISHLGSGHKGKEVSLKWIFPVLKEYYKTSIDFIQTSIFQLTREQIVKKLDKHPIILLENIRMYAQEAKNDAQFSKRLASFADIYVNDAFAVSHRKHASVFGITQWIPSYAGLLFMKEITQLEKIEKESRHPKLLLLGGKKGETKLPLIKRGLRLYDHILLGGIMANTFLRAKGIQTGASFVEEAFVKDAKKLLFHKNIILPVDVICATSLRVKKNVCIKDIQNIKAHEYILDIGPRTQKMYKSYIQNAKTIVWNGPLGYYEHRLFKKGTQCVAQSILNACAHAFTVIGGGETLDVLHEMKQIDRIGHVSTGGGAMLSFLTDQTIIAIKPLIK